MPQTKNPIWLCSVDGAMTIDIKKMAEVCDLGRVCGPLDTLFDDEWESLLRFAQLNRAAVIKELIEGVGEPKVRQERWNYNGYGEITSRGPDFTAYTKEQVAGAVAKAKDEVETKLSSGYHAMAVQDNKRIKELEAQNAKLRDSLGLLRVAIQTGYPEYGLEDWIDLIDTAIKETGQ